MILFWIIASTIIISLLSLIGIITLIVKKNKIKDFTIFLVSLSAGALMGGAFIHLIPEAMESGTETMSIVLMGFILFFLIEKVLHWRHCHKEKCEIHSFAYMNLVGDSLHNFIDGLIIAAAFVSSIPLGITTSIAIALHEIPQELGDFGVLIHGGFSVKKGLIINFMTAITAIFGGIAGYAVAGIFEHSAPILLSIAAGGFIYIAASDLIPEMRKTKSSKHSAYVFMVFIIGILIMHATKVLV